MQNHIDDAPSEAHVTAAMAASTVCGMQPAVPLRVRRRRPQAQPQTSKAEAAALGRLTRWLGAFATTAGKRAAEATAVEALDDVRGLELLLPASCLARDPSGLDGFSPDSVRVPLSPRHHPVETRSQPKLVW